MNRNLVSFAVLALTLIALSAPVAAAPYVLTTSTPQAKVPAVVDTVWTLGGSADTLMFGFPATDVCIDMTAATGNVTRKWVGLYPSKAMSQSRGTTPPAASRAKARYGANTFSSSSLTTNSPFNDCAPLAYGFYYGIIVSGSGLLHIYAGPGK